MAYICVENHTKQIHGPEAYKAILSCISKGAPSQLLLYFTERSAPDASLVCSVEALNYDIKDMSSVLPLFTEPEMMGHWNRIFAQQNRKTCDQFISLLLAMPNHFGRKISNNKEELQQTNKDIACLKKMRKRISPRKKIVLSPVLILSTSLIMLFSQERRQYEIVEIKGSRKAYWTIRQEIDKRKLDCNPDHLTCISYGLKKGSSAYVDCRMERERAADEQKQLSTFMSDMERLQKNQHQHEDIMRIY